jgi:co-chaperonin GroES (HSP10)
MADKKIKVLRALNDMVIIRFVEIEQTNRTTAGGIELVGTKANEPIHEAIVDSIGSGVSEDRGFEVGDSVIFNEHDLKQFDVENPADMLNPIRKGIMKSTSVWGIYE